MVYSYKITKKCNNDIDSTIAYIVNDLCNGKAASDLMDLLESDIDKICKQPFIPSDCKIYGIMDETIRHKNIKNYVLFYQVDIKMKNINLIRFLHGKMDINEMNVLS